MTDVVNVAIGVIYFKQQYLLAYRFANQHQGNKYEFVGGKIEAFETPQQALIREVKEEIDIDVAPKNISSLGQITHKYSDKQVCLHVFLIAATQQQYQYLKNVKVGKLAQPIVWVDKADLLANNYRLPDANQVILDWLKNH